MDIANTNPEKAAAYRLNPIKSIFEFGLKISITTP
jgi:adenosine deaminase